MRAGDAVGMVMRPTVSGTLRARRAKKEHGAVTAKQWIAYIAVAVLTTWLTRKLDDLIEEHLAAEPPG